MPRLKLFFDLFIAALLSGLLYFIYRSQPSPKPYTFHPADYNFHNLKQICFQNPAFTLDIPDLYHPQLSFDYRRIPASANKLHRYIDNIYQLPEVEEFPMSDTKEGYGFSEEPDILFINKHAANENTVIPEGVEFSFGIYLGSAVPGNRDFFYISFRDGYVAQLANVYYANLKWAKELFLPPVPIGKDWSSLHFSNSNVLLNGLSFLRQETRWQIIGGTEIFDVSTFVLDIQGLYMDAVLDVTNFSNCQPLFVIDQEEIQLCAEGFVNTSYAYGWQHNTRFEKWRENFPLNVFSRSMSTYVPEKFWQSTKISCSDNREINQSLSSFASRLSRLQRAKGLITYQHFIGKPFSLHFQTTDDSFTLSGILSADDLFSFLILDRCSEPTISTHCAAYFQIDLAKFLN